jgi:D-citramalate synthase
LEKKTICFRQNFVKANIEKNFKVGFETKSRRFKLVTQRIIELGDKKKTVTKEDLTYISDVLHSKIFEEKNSESYTFTHKGMRPSTTLSLQLTVVN